MSVGIRGEIEKSRKELNKLGISNGLKDPEVIQKSQALDELTNGITNKQIKNTERPPLKNQ